MFKEVKGLGSFQGKNLEKPRGGFKEYKIGSEKDKAKPESPPLSQKENLEKTRTEFEKGETVSTKKGLWIETDNGKRALIKEPITGKIIKTGKGFVVIDFNLPNLRKVKTQPSTMEIL